jgi:hypothetical protein
MSNKPIDMMDTDDLVRAWVQESDVKTPLDETAYKTLVTMCRSMMTDLRDVRRKGNDGKFDAKGMVMPALVSWCNRFSIPYPKDAVPRLVSGLCALAGWDRPSHADPVLGEYGTPYSVEEARLMAEEGGLDEHHKEIILWLCDRVERLQAELAAATPKPLDKQEVLQAKHGARLEHLFISSFVATFPEMAKRDPRIKAIVDADKLTMTLVVNGVPLDAGKACLEWEKQSERIVAEAAGKLLLEKLGEKRNAILELMDEIRDSIMDKMRTAGIRLPEDEG